MDGQHFAIAKKKLDELFLHWLSFESTQEYVSNMLDECSSWQASSSLQILTQSPSKTNSPPPRSPTSPSQLSSAFDKATSPHRTPNKPPLKGDSGKSPHAAGSKAVPQFYVRKKKREREEAERTWESTQASIVDFVKEKGGHLSRSDLEEFNKEFMKLPKMFVPGIYDRLKDEKGLIAEKDILPFFKDKVFGKPLKEAAFWVVCSNEGYVRGDDFKPLVRNVIDTHPGLDFLKATPEFQDRYLETVCMRIVYTLNRCGNGKVTLREFVKSDLVDQMFEVEADEDINKELKYFSYEHFYVIYCKFWELDTDHDFLIDKDDLLKYANYSLTYRIVERVFSGAGRPLTSGVTGKMGYEDFLWFLLSEEDKNSTTALDYWFKCIDIDMDGFLSFFELNHFYDEQMHRMECLSQEVVTFEDILCQLIDMVKPVNEIMIAKKDVRDSKLGGNFFNMLFNLNKFIQSENRDPLQIQHERATPELNDWDRFAAAEYARLSLEEEDEDDDGLMSTEGSNEAPF